MAKSGAFGLDAEKVDVVPQDLYGLLQENVAVTRLAGGWAFALLGYHGRRQTGRGGVLERNLIGRGLGSGMGQLFLLALVLTGRELRQLLTALGFVERNRFLGKALLEPSDILSQIGERLFRADLMEGSLPQDGKIGLHPIQLFM